MHSRALRAALIILAVFLVLWIASELLIPRLASSYAKREIQKRYPQATDLSVSIRAFPALKLAFKKYDSLKVSARNITIEGVKFDTISLDSPGWPGGTFEATIVADQINTFFSVATTYLIDPTVTIEDNTLKVSAFINANGSTVPIDATGTLHALNGRFVYFVPQKIAVGGTQVNQNGINAVNAIISRNPIFTVRENLPFSISGTSIEQGKLKITGNVDLSKVLSISM